MGNNKLWRRWGANVILDTFSCNPWRAPTEDSELLVPAPAQSRNRWRRQARQVATEFSRLHAYRTHEAHDLPATTHPSPADPAVLSAGHPIHRCEANIVKSVCAWTIQRHGGKGLVRA
eukprot:3594375-Amphidinium_carterae.1